MGAYSWKTRKNRVSITQRNTRHCHVNCVDLTGISKVKLKYEIAVLVQKYM